MVRFGLVAYVCLFSWVSWVGCLCLVWLVKFDWLLGLAGFVACLHLSLDLL